MGRAGNSSDSLYRFEALVNVVRHSKRRVVKHALAWHRLAAFPGDQKRGASSEPLDEAIERLDRWVVVADKDAIAEFKKSLIINPEELVTIPDYTISALLNLGNTYYLEGKIKKAIKSYERVLKIDPTNKSAHRNINLVKSKINAIK